MQQVHDFIEECDVLATQIATLEEAQYDMPSQFKKWTINDILVHLHFWNMAADMSLHQPEKFSGWITGLRNAIKSGTLRDFENGQVKERGPELLERWQAFYQNMGEIWVQVDPKTRVSWAGPDMSVRSSMSARQMETWAHGQAVFDLLGQKRPESDRLKNIVFLGINAFGWSHKVHALPVPETMPKMELVSPSGDLWEFGDKVAGIIKGRAVEFCQVVTQTRNIADTALEVTGDVAKGWMKNAQCFAGPPEAPPAPGTRFKASF